MVELTISGEIGDGRQRSKDQPRSVRLSWGIFRRAAPRNIEDDPPAFYRLG
jgi:hypothetical protein